MSISSANRRAGPFVGNGIVDEFPFDFRVFRAEDLLVVVADEDGLESTLELDTDYTVEVNADQTNDPGGVVVLNDPLTDDYRMVLSSQVAATQEVELTNQGGFYPNVINGALDKLTIVCQQFAERLDRSLFTPITDDSGPVLQFPTVAGRAGTVLAFDEDGAMIAGPSIISVGTVLDNVAAINLVAANIVDVQNAEENATAAIAAAATAVAARDAVLAAYDSFDDRYLGSKTSDPTTDNDGNALVPGTLYYNSVTPAMMIYEGVVLGWVAAYVSGGGYVPITRTITTTGLLGGGGDLSANRVFDVPIASQVEAEAGASNVKAMTPLRTAQAITSLLLLTRTARTSNVALAVADKGKLTDVTANTFTQTAASAATMGNGWFHYYRNSGAGIVTLPGGLGDLLPGQSCMFMSDGSAFYFVFPPVGGKGIEIFLAGGTFTPRPGVVLYDVKLKAGGGGGGSSGSGAYGGGGEGGAVEGVVAITTAQTVTIGAGGALGAVGGNSSIGTLVTANGGATAGTGIPGGVGGAPGTTPTGCVGLTGQSGSPGPAVGPGNGAGGGSGRGRGGDGSAPGADGVAIFRWG